MWDITTPAGNEKLVRGDDRIREWKQDLEYALTEEHNFSIVNNSPSVTHKFLYGDETTKPLPSATSNRFFIHTAKNVMQFENAGSWEDIVSCFPSGTRMIFANLSAITGWTRVSISEKLLKVKGGDTNEGGNWQVSGYAMDEKDMDHNHRYITIKLLHSPPTGLEGCFLVFDSTEEFTPITHPITDGIDQGPSNKGYHIHNIETQDWKLKYFVCTVCGKD